MASVNRYIEPLRLTDLGFEAFLSFLLDYCDSEIKSAKNSEPSINIEFKVLDTAYRNFLLPPFIADNISNELILRFNSKYVKKSYWGSGYSCGELEKIKHLIPQLIHPNVTTIALNSRHLCKYQKTDFDFLNPIVSKEIPSLEHLKAFHMKSIKVLKSTIFVRDFTALKVYPNLTQLTASNSLVDDDIPILVEVCNSLTFLDMTSCRKVTELSVDHILKLKHLTGLLINNTYISESGIILLLKSLSEDENKPQGDKFRRFGCSLFNDETNDLIIKKFPNLEELDMRFSHVTNFSFLTDLPKLKILSLNQHHYLQHSFCDILSLIGAQLVCLDLNYKEVDYELVGEHCHQLKCLHVMSWGPNAPTYNPCIRGKKLPGLESVECLRICINEMNWDFNWTLFLLYQCSNIKTLYLEYSCPSALQIIFKYFTLNHLEKLIWWPEKQIQEDVINLIIEKCPRLQSVRGLCFANACFKFHRGVKFYQCYDFYRE